MLKPYRALYSPIAGTGISSRLKRSTQNTIGRRPTCWLVASARTLACGVTAPACARSPTAPVVARGAKRTRGFLTAEAARRKQ